MATLIFESWQLELTFLVPLEYKSITLRISYVYRLQILTLSYYVVWDEQSLCVDCLWYIYRLYLILRGVFLKLEAYALPWSDKMPQFPTSPIKTLCMWNFLSSSGYRHTWVRYLSWCIEELIWLRGLTYIVKATATTRIAYPESAGENLCRRCRATNAQKTITGTIISNKVTSSDLASGPNINLPPRMNFWGHRKKIKNCKIISFIY